MLSQAVMPVAAAPGRAEYPAAVPP
jgi:hypothetical protein